jgi:hypothetical protein
MDMNEAIERGRTVEYAVLAGVISLLPVAAWLYWRLDLREPGHTRKQLAAFRSGARTPGMTTRWIRRVPQEPYPLAPRQATAVAITPGWLRSEMMLAAYDVTEDNWRSAAAPPGFAVSESPRYVGRAVAALASDARRGRWNQRSVTSAQLASEYGFTDVDGSRPDVWRFEQAVENGDADASPDDYR